jgi:hypothetical protein
MKDGFDIHRRSRVRSFLVGSSMTCVRLWSFSEINLSLPKIKQKPHKVYQYKKANWEKIEQDLQTTHSHMKENQNHMDVNDLLYRSIHFWVVY